MGDVSSEQDYTMQGIRGSSFVDRKGRFFYTSEGTKAPVAVVVILVVRMLDATIAVDPPVAPASSAVVSDFLLLRVIFRLVLMILWMS